jgi:hypothetical protein
VILLTPSVSSCSGERGHTSPRDQKSQHAAFLIAWLGETVLSGNSFSLKTLNGTAGMFQLINGTIECGECRNDIRHGEEFTCEYCGASICASCLFHHEDECVFSQPEDKRYNH